MPGGLPEAIQAAKSALLSPWDRPHLERLANSKLPDLPIRSAWLLEADVHALWLRWLIEAAIPANLASPSLNTLQLAADLITSADNMLRTSMPILNESERRRTARIIAEIAFQWIRAEENKRDPLTRAEKWLVLTNAGTPPRCWICGEPFLERAIQRFKRTTSAPLTPAAFVDCFYPKGLKKNDFQCQVEHVLPVAAGGTNDPGNLQLSCGYCNRVKRDSLDLYARTAGRGFISHPTFGKLRLPHPYWICRLLVVDGKCSICSASNKDAALRAGPSHPSRYINPSNLVLYCTTHDPFSETRWVPASTFLRATP